MADCPAGLILTQGDQRVRLICTLDAGHLGEHFHRFFNLHWWKGENGSGV
jgi:hypothetical protein